MQPTLPPPLNSHVAVWFLITNTSAQYFLSNWKVFFHIYYSLYLIIFMFTAIFTWLMEKLTTEKSVLLYVEDKERVYNNKKEEVKEHKRSSKLKDNSYSNFSIVWSISNIHFQPLNLVRLSIFTEIKFSWSTFCLFNTTNPAEYLVKTKFSCTNILNLL